MSNKNFENLKMLSELALEQDSELAFTILEIGALPLEGEVEPFHKFLELFPNSQIIAFEVDEKLCEDLNKKAPPGLTYHPIALALNEGEHKFYETNHPMCCSLYKPNEELNNMYNNLEVANLKSETTINAVSLDHFTKINNIDSVDMIKIDIQGAELDVFRGGVNSLKNITTIVSEVEFIKLYIDQPLFGDVCSFLAENDIMFHKFLGMAGRALKPVIVNNDVNFPSQHMWSDGMFIRDVLKLSELPSSKLLKMGLIAFIYGSLDVTFQCFKNYDDKNGTAIHKTLLNI